MLLGFSVRFHDDIWGANRKKFLSSYERFDMALPYPRSPWDFFMCCFLMKHKEMKCVWPEVLPIMVYCPKTWIP